MSKDTFKALAAVSALLIFCVVFATFLIVVVFPLADHWQHQFIQYLKS